MSDSTNNSFEEQWQHAFDNAELTPPASVWEKIELGLKPENTLPSKPNFGNKPYYFLGGILMSLLGLFVWFNNTEKESQVIEKQEVIIKKPIFKNESNPSEKVAEVIGEGNKHGVTKPLSVSPQTTINMEDPGPVETQITTTENKEETPIRTFSDSVEMIEPVAIKSIHSEIENPTINLPTDQTPYYVKPQFKPPKKSILKNVKISAGVGIYQ